MEDYCTYEQCVRLKELGFDWECFVPYVDGRIVGFHPSPINWNAEADDPECELISAPNLLQAAKWLREVKGVSVEPFSSVVGKDWAYQLYHTQKDKFGLSVVVDKKCVKEYGYATYEQSLSAGIDKCLELLKI